MRYRGFLTLLVPVVLVACGGDDHYIQYVAPPPGTYASLQVVNASVDAPPMDVILDGKPFVRGLNYGQGTGEQQISAGSHTLAVQIETPGTPTTVIGTTTLDASANMDYVVAVEGTVGSLQAPGVSLVTFPHELAVVPSQSTRIQVLNAYNVPITAYLTAPGADVSSSPPLGTAPVAGSIGPTAVSAGEWELWIAVPGCAVAPHDLGPIELQGGTDLMFSVLIPYFPPGEAGALALPCGLSFETVVDAFGNNTWLNPAGAVLRVINDSPDAPALAITANGNVTTPLVTTLAYESSTSYLGVGEPGAYDLAMTPASNLSDVLASQRINLGAGMNYSLYALGPLAQIVPFVTRDDYRPYSTQARLRLIQGSKSAQLVDVYLTAPGAGIASATPTDAAMPFATGTDFVSYVEGSYDLTVTLAGSKTPIIGPVSVTLNNGGVYTAVARDAPGGGAPYGLIELDDL
ncbi:MAG TPA: DUF4397 domain-containing protein [Steroidobacteraceae bacterium]|nr:DUF4397 domain-containing protein [Steroidobacteraceae bacterium]